MMDFEIRRYEEIDSTNTEARRLSQGGADERLVVVAQRQRAGKGRRGRGWESAESGNLYFSLLLKPDLNPEKAPMLTLVMAYSTARAILRLVDGLGTDSQCAGQKEPCFVQIKWPNDLLVAGKKVCGILTEMHLSDTQIDDVVIGVGINVNGRIFSEELKDKATSLALELGKQIDKESLLQDILIELKQQYAKFLEVQDLSFLQKEYNALLVNCKKEVRVLTPGHEYIGIALGINELGELLVQRESGSVDAVYAGEVSVRGIYGYI